MNRARFSIPILICCLAPLASAPAQSTPPGNSFLDVAVPVAPMTASVSGQTCLVYELHITNFRPTAVTITRVDILQGGTPLHAFQGAELATGLGLVGTRPRGTDVQRLEGGQRVVFYVWLALPGHTVPSAIQHRISFRSDAGDALYVETAEVHIAKSAPPALGPPLRGGPWVAVYDPSMKNGHRRVFFAIDGKARIPARFAVDWIKLGPDGRVTHDDASVASNSYSYGEDVLAVADGVIAAIQDGLPEPTPNISVTNEAGNYLALDLGEGRFAFYEHLKPGSIRVKLHQHVRVGEVLGSVGASGSVFSGAHLHFHVADTSSSIAAEGVPFVLRKYLRLGSFESFAALSQPWAAPAQGERTTHSMDMPAPLTVVRFD